MKVEGGTMENASYSDLNPYQQMGLIKDLDDAINGGYLDVELFVKKGDGEVQVETKSNGYDLMNYDGLTKSGGIRIKNTSRSLEEPLGRFFLFSVRSENDGYFASVESLGDLGSDSTITFILGPDMKMEFDIDSEYDNLDVCYLEGAYRTGQISQDGVIQYEGRFLDYDSAHDNEVYIRFQGEVTRADLPVEDFTFVAGHEGGLASFATAVLDQTERVTGFDEGRSSTRTADYNTVKVKVVPGFPVPTLVRELIPGFPVSVGVNFSDGSIGEGPVGSLFPGDGPGPVISVSQNLPAIFYPFTKDDGSRYTVMDLAEADAPDLLKIQAFEGITGNQIEKLGDLPYFRYWGDLVLMTPIVVTAVGTGVFLFFAGPPLAGFAAKTIVPYLKQAGTLPLTVVKGLGKGVKDVGVSFKSFPKAFKEGMED